MLHGARGTGTLVQDPTFFGAILYAELAFFMLRLSFSYAPWGTFHPSPCLSLHRHVSILLSTCLFSYAHGSFSYACGFSFYAIGVFLLICPFLVLSPLLLMLHGAGGTGGGAPLYKTRPFLVLSFMRSWLLFMLRLSFSYAPWGTFHPSPCLCLHLHVSHPVVDIFFSDCEPYLFLCCSCPSCAPWAKGWGRGGHGAH